MLFEITLVLLLILANGFFSSAEIAVISARKSVLKERSDEGDKNAQFVTKLQNNPEPFLATVQIGVTLLGSAAAAIGGVTAVESIKPLLDTVPALRPFSEVLAITAVILTISYFSLVLGELVPKSLALKYSDQIALGVVRPIKFFSRIFHPLVRLLTASTRLFLGSNDKGKLFSRSFISEEEIKFLMKEGREKGVFDATEQELIHSIFEFTDISVKEVMVARPKIHAIQLETSPQAILEYIVENTFSRVPVYRDNLNDIVGILYFKDLLSTLAEKKDIVIKDLLHTTYFVPETMQVSHLMKELQRRRIQIAIVINEYGSVEGLVTLEDLIEEIVGEIEDEYDIEDRPVERLKDGSWVIDASLSVRDLRSDHSLPIPESSDYETLGGFVLSQLQGMPKGGEIIRHDDYKFTIVDMDGRRIAKLKVEKKKMPMQKKKSSKKVAKNS